MPHKAIITPAQYGIKVASLDHFQHRQELGPVGSLA